MRIVAAGVLRSWHSELQPDHIAGVSLIEGFLFLGGNHVIGRNNHFSEIGNDCLIVVQTPKRGDLSHELASPFLKALRR